MQNISDLIKEAKPLYFARKRRNNFIKSGMAVLVGLFLVISGWTGDSSDEIFYYWDYGYNETEIITYVEKLGLPVDDYGLLLVS